MKSIAIALQFQKFENFKEIIIMMSLGMDFINQWTKTYVQYICHAYLCWSLILNLKFNVKQDLRRYVRRLEFETAMKMVLFCITFSLK